MMLFLDYTYEALVAPLPVSYIIDDEAYISVGNLTFECKYSEDNSNCVSDI